MDDETPPAEDFAEAAAVPVTNRSRTERFSKKPDFLAFTIIPCEDNGSRNVTEATQDKKDVLDSNNKSALLMAALGGDAWRTWRAL